MKFPKLKAQAVLSPMAGVTDVAFRVLSQQYGAALTYTEFVNSTAIVRDSKRSLQMLKTSPKEKPVAVQLFGSSVQDIVQAAQRVEDDFDVIDVNCGCPAWKVIKTGAGSALLNNPEKIESFVSKLSSAVSKPVTVKIRTGIDEKNINAIEVAKRIENAGASALAIHGRTQKQGYTGQANWDIIKQVKEAINIPVIGNGDVFSPEDFKEKIEYSGVDYIMIARGAMTNPFIFHQIDQHMKSGSYEQANKVKLFLEYLTLAQEQDIVFSQIKTHAMSFTKGITGGGKMRLEIGKKNTAAEIKDLFKTYSEIQTGQ